MIKRMIKLFLIMIFIICLLIIPASAIKENDRKISIDYKLLSKMYFETDSIAFFNWDTLYDQFNTRLNIYNINWLLTMQNELNIDLEAQSKEEIISFLDKINYDLLSQKNLFEILNIVKTEKMIFGQMKNDQVYLKRILELYDKDGLFLLESKTDNMTQKIIATNLSLQIFDLIGRIPEDLLQNIKTKNISLLEAEDYFNYQLENVKKNLFTGGLVIIDNLRIIDKYCQESMKPHIKSKLKWMNYWLTWLNNYIKSLNNLSIPATKGIISFKKIYDYIELDCNFEESYLYNISEQYIKKMLYKDLQLAYKALLLTKIYNKDISTNIRPIIDDHLKYWLYKTYPPSIFIRDVFYGLILSDNYSFNYDKDKILKYLDDYIENKELVIKDLYYISNIYKQLNQEYSEKIIELVSQTLTNNSDYTFPENIRNIYFSLELAKRYQINLLSDLNWNINKKNIEDQLVKVQSDIELYYILRTAKLLKMNINSELIRDAIFNLYNEDGFFVTDTVNKIENIYSTYRMLKLIKLYDITLEIEQLENISNYLESLKGDFGGYYMTRQEINYKDVVLNYRSNLTLKSFYCGLSSVEIINEFFFNQK
ncbi:MAG: hypothetical protein KAX49_10935 [Halanaerobiales bacterium]|nr:hypothetical protein [Halanaerobiales bacterium]